MLSQAVAQGPDLSQLLLDGHGIVSQPGLQTHDRLIVEAAPVPLCGRGKPGMERFGQVFERDGFGHGSQRSDGNSTIMEPSWFPLLAS